MQTYDVASWLTPFSWWPDDMAYVQADAASLAVMQLMGASNLQRVYKVVVNDGDGLVRHWWDMVSLK